jgi:hypothetical protein
LVIQGFREFGANQSEVGALRKMLNHLGIMAPHNGEPFSEELLFGIGGGIGFAYFLFEKSGKHPSFLGTRVHTKETERPEFLQIICDRLGIPAHVQNSSSANAAAANMQRNLEQGRAPIVWLDAARLPYLGLNATMNTHHAVVVYGVEEADDRVMISDSCPGPVTLTREQFRAARETSWSPKYRTMLVQKTDTISDIRAATEAGIRDCLQQMTQGLGITNFGLKGMEKWATVLTSSREKKSWLKIFPPGPALFESLFSVFCQIRLRSSDGSALRGMYADFLDQAALLIERPELREVANLFRHSERMWTDLAEAHLPDSIPQFKELKQLAVDRKTLFDQRGAEALDEIVRMRDRIEQISNEMRQQFPLGASESKALLTDLRIRILRLKEHEAEAVRALDRAMEGARWTHRQEERVREEPAHEESVHEEEQHDHSQPELTNTRSE